MQSKQFFNCDCNKVAFYSLKMHPTIGLGALVSIFAENKIFIKI